MRRAFFLIPLSFVVSCLLIACDTSKLVIEGQHAIISTSTGKLRGHVHAKGPDQDLPEELNLKHGPVLEFLGFPYARAERWKDPEQYTWHGIKDALEFGSVCPSEPTQGFYYGREDCLAMSIWAPLDVATKKPVLVWFPTASFELFSVANPALSGRHIAAQENVVFVSLNSRAGALGYLRLQLDDGTLLEGNYGIKDQIFALQWIQKNIHLFGGDPDRVTLMGDGAGGQTVGLHMVSIPASEDLFHSGIPQSNFLAPLRTAAQAEAMGQQFLKFTGCNLTPDPLACLQALPARLIVAAQSYYSAVQLNLTIPNLRKLKYQQVAEAGGYYRTAVETWQPVVDGSLIVRQPVDGTFQKPVMMGHNLNEGRYIGAYINGTKRIYDRAGFIERYLTPAFGADNVSTITGYPGYRMTPANWRSVWYQMMTDAFFACPMRTMAKNSASSAPLRIYRFDHHPNITEPLSLTYHLWSGTPNLCNPDGVVCHGAESPFSHKYLPLLFGSQEWDLSSRMIAYYANFARTDDPNGTGLPDWPAATPTDLKYTLLDYTQTDVNDPYRDVCEQVWDRVGYTLDD